MLKLSKSILSQVLCINPVIGKNSFGCVFNLLKNESVKYNLLLYSLISLLL